MINNKIFLNVLDLLYPNRCVSCGDFADLVCNYCLGCISYSEQYCIGCNKQSKNGLTCQRCLSINPLLPDQIIAVCEYENAAVKKIISNLKYVGITRLAKQCAKIIYDYVHFFGLDAALRDFYVSYVPLHKTKKLTRGFNQSKLIAEELSKLLELPLFNLLEKIKKTEAQMNLGRAQRLENLKGAFKAQNCKQKNILLVDDVITTGSTIKECAKALKQSGANTVIALIFAKD